VDAPTDTGIGITFNQRVSAGTGNVTLSLVAVGSTLVENFSVGSSVTYNNDADPPNITITPTDTLDANTVYAISYPSGAFTQSGAGGSFVGTAYTFDTGAATFGALWVSGGNYGNDFAPTQRSSPVQAGGADTQWKHLNGPGGYFSGIRQNNTLWGWGSNEQGELGDNSRTRRSSPIQIPGTWSQLSSSTYDNQAAINTDGELWVWGWNGYGGLGQNNITSYSSPVQVGSDTDWSDVETGNIATLGLKTNGTLWAWGRNNFGGAGQNNTTQYSSPVQIPGTTWSTPMAVAQSCFVTKTDGTLWAWGSNTYGKLGQNEAYSPSKKGYSSPVQIPGTTWTNVDTEWDLVMASKSDGTLWTWGRNNDGQLGHNSGSINYSSPTQIPGTNWSSGFSAGNSSAIATKTDGTLWNWGMKSAGKLGQNSVVYFSSPVQIPGTNWSSQQGHQTAGDTHHYIKLA